MKKMAINLMILLISSSIFFLISELIIRNVGSYDVDAQFYFQEEAIPPLQLPLGNIQELLDDYLQNVNTARLIYDADLGWTNQKNFTSEDSSIIINSQGLRSTQTYSENPPSNTLRVALFGDSFTFGGEVANTETWGHYLEETLLAKGWNIEILNFGISGYGMDQAYIRWQLEGKQFQPDIVFFAYVPNDIDRNTSIFRVILQPLTSIPFSKPRFIVDDGKLISINQPTIPIEDIVSSLQHFDTNPLRPYESAYDSRYDIYWWSNSKLLSVLAYKLFPPTSSSLDTYSDDELSVTQAIVEAFGDSVTESGSKFIVLHMPSNFFLASTEDQSRYYEVLDNLARQYPLWYMDEVVDPQDTESWMPGFHYSPKLNQIIGNLIAENLISCIEDTTCLADRFTSSQDFTKQD